MDEGSVSKKLEKYIESDSKFKGKFLDRLHNIKTILKHKPESSLEDALLSLRDKDGRVSEDQFAATKPISEEKAA
jgi:hypothetical protein